MKHLALSVLGPDKPGIVNELTKLAALSSCNIIECRINAFGNEFAASMLLGGNWSSIARFEANLPSLANKYELHVMVRRTEPRNYQQQMLPYSIYVTAIDTPGIVCQITEFFAEEGINLNELNIDTYIAPHTYTAMATLAISISIPIDMHVADLRERFMLLCDDLNLDVIMEPEKN